MEFRTIELRDASGELVCQEPIHQPATSELFVLATFGGRVFQLNSADANPPRAEYYEAAALMPLPSLPKDIEGVEVERIVDALTTGRT